MKYFGKLLSSIFFVGLFSVISFSAATIAAFAQDAPPAESTSYLLFSATADTLELNDKAQVSAIWTTPRKTPEVVAVILPGSGNVGEDGDVSSPLVGQGFHGQAPLLSRQIAEALAIQGVASLRYAKRGFEDATQLANQTVPFLVKDAKVALAAARARFPEAKVMLIGFSEGALVATIVASDDDKLDGLFLLGTPSRSIAEILEYQFRHWAPELVRNRVDENKDGVLSAQELERVGHFGLPFVGPNLGPAEPLSLDKNGDGQLSIQDEVAPAYEALYGFAQQLVKSPAFAGWYDSMMALRPFGEYAAKVKSPVFMYHGLNDAQVRSSWAYQDRKLFTAAPKRVLQLFSDVGHCFSPMDGVIGEVKTSGPLDDKLLETLVRDVWSLVL